MLQRQHAPKITLVKFVQKHLFFQHDMKIMFISVSKEIRINMINIYLITDPKIHVIYI